MTLPALTGARCLVAMTTLLVALGVSVVAAQPAAEPEQPVEETVILQLRIWQRVSDPEELLVSSRRVDGRWDELGTFRIQPNYTGGPSYSPEAEYPVTVQKANATVHYGSSGIHPGRHRVHRILFPQIAILRVWQREQDPSLIWVDLVKDRYNRPYSTWWSPLGLTPLSLEDGRSPRGHYRYGDLQIAVPTDSPGLRGDRNYLLAMRDVLTGVGAELDWAVGRPVSEWEGVTLSGSPRRVTKLELSNRGLAGEIWGWLGELGELTELRLDGNSLTGLIPSKLSLLTNLKVLRLAGNSFSGCSPLALHDINDHDIDALGLPDCPSPTRLHDTGGRLPEEGLRDLTSGTYWVQDIGGSFGQGCEFCLMVFDVPTGRSISVTAACPWGEYDPEDLWTVWDNICGVGLHDAEDNDVWVFLEQEYGFDAERSHSSGCVYDCGRQKSPAALLEQLAASAYVISTRTGERQIWP